MTKPEGQVHRDFADWYRAVSLIPNAEEMTKRHTGVRTFSKEASVRDLADLSRLLYGLPLQDPSFEERFRGAFKATDGTFAMRNNTAELRVLAGASLVHHLEFDNPWPSAAALMIVCASFQGHRPPPIRGILELGIEGLRRQSVTLRNQIFTPPQQSEIAGQLEAIKAAAQSNALPSLVTPLSEALRQITDAVNGLSEWASQMTQDQLLRKEESDVLWWLAGEYSRDLATPFRDLQNPAACLLVPKELSDLVRILPGPFAAEAFIDKAVKAAHPGLGAISLSEALTSCPAEWSKTLVVAENLAWVFDLCPIHLAIQKYLDAGKKPSWRAAFQNLTGIKATDKVDPQLIAFQTYQERLLLRAVAELEKANGD